MNELEEHETNVYVAKAGKMYVSETDILAGITAISPSIKSAKFLQKNDAIRYAKMVNGTAYELVLREDEQHED